MKTIIAGGRDYQWGELDFLTLDVLKRTIGISEVISGAARGADRLGEEWGRERELKVTTYPANWKRDGKKAGILRNVKMAEVADALVAFPGGRGTDHMKKEARRRGLVIYTVDEKGFIHSFTGGESSGKMNKRGG